MRPNRLREMLDAGEPTLGTHMIVPWPGMAEIIGASGTFDYIEYVGEYSPFNLDLMDNIGRAIDLYPSLSSMMKIEEQTRGFIAQRAVDSGIQNVLFTDVRTADDVRDCVRLVRSEDPDAGGIHGTGMRRAAGWVLEGGSPAWVEAMNQTVIAVMIEKKGAVENLEEILSVEGLDMVQFGPSDYSISVGKAGKGGSDEIQATQRHVVERALAHGVHPRIELGSMEQAQKWWDLGVRHFCVGWDIGTVFRWCRNEAGYAKTLMGRTSEDKSKGTY